MLSVFQNKKPTQEEIDKLVEYIQDLVDNKSFEEVHALAKTDWSHWMKVMTFFRLPKTELHEQFREKFIKPTSKLRWKYLESYIIDQMKKNKEEFIREHKIDSYQFSDVKYQIHDRYFIGTWDKSDQVMNISIPYFSPRESQDKFWYWITLYRSHAPEFFDRLLKDMKVYQWNASLTSNRK